MKTRAHYEKLFAAYPDVVTLPEFQTMLGGIGDSTARKIMRANKVKQDEAMAEMVESVRKYGVLVPALVRPKADGGYEMVAGHRRKFAATLAELPEIPCIVRDLTDDEATVIMVDSNLQRETILPSEKAFAYADRFR